MVWFIGSFNAVIETPAPLLSPTIDSAFPKCKNPPRISTSLYLVFMVYHLPGTIQFLLTFFSVSPYSPPQGRIFIFSTNWNSKLLSGDFGRICVSGLLQLWEWLCYLALRMPSLFLIPHQEAFIHSHKSLASSHLSDGTHQGPGKVSVGCDRTNMVINFMSAAMHFHSPVIQVRIVSTILCFYLCHSWPWTETNDLDVQYIFSYGPSGNKF